MTNSPFRSGTVVSYPYLWSAQFERGETEGRKSRPACLALSLRDSKQDIHHLMLVAITSKQPSPDQVALEIPDIERARAGLTRYSRAWIVVSEYNYDIAENSWYFDTTEKPLGEFSGRFLRLITDALRKEMRAGGRRVDRTK